MTITADPREALSLGDQVRGMRINQVTGAVFSGRITHRQAWDALCRVHDIPDGLAQAYLARTKAWFDHFCEFNLDDAQTLGRAMGFLDNFFMSLPEGPKVPQQGDIPLVEAIRWCHTFDLRWTAVHASKRPAPMFATWHLVPGGSVYSAAGYTTLDVYRTLATTGSLPDVDAAKTLAILRGFDFLP